MPAPKINEITTSVERAALMGLEVLAWRYEELERAGYPTDIAIALAERSEVDLHLACALLERGATVQEATRILA